jgi:hypothetical protein
LQHDWWLGDFEEVSYAELLEAPILRIFTKPNPNWQPPKVWPINTASYTIVGLGKSSDATTIDSRARRVRIIRLALSAALASSALVGVQILTTDFWLWSAAPTHAYGLMAFVALDFALVYGVWRRTRLAVFGAVLTATVQLAAMMGDIIAGEPAGVPGSVFRSYLLADTAYLGLLTTQGIIMAIAIGMWAVPHLHPHWLTHLRIIRK